MVVMVWWVRLRLRVEWIDGTSLAVENLRIEEKKSKGSFEAVHSNRCPWKKVRKSSQFMLRRRT